MQRGGRVVTRRWPNDPEHRALLDVPRDDLVLEQRAIAVPAGVPGDAPTSGAAEFTQAEFTRAEFTQAEFTRAEFTQAEFTQAEFTQAEFTQAEGPFRGYLRTVERRDGELVEVTRFELTIPWFGWLFRRPVRGVLARRFSSQGWWAPPDRLDAPQVLVLGLLAAASMSAAFVNTLFNQTVTFAADDFDVGNTGVGIAGAVVRLGIVIALPAAVIADRKGRRRVIIAVAWLCPLLSVLGAVAPNFVVLVATQTLARPMGIALAFLVGVVAAEEMPRNTRAYAVSILAMAAGFGAGVAVIALSLTDLGPNGWRLVYLVSLVWCVVALDLTRRLPETRRFTAAHITATSRRPPINMRRLGLLATVAFAGNIFIAPASFFQNRYLTDVHGFSGSMIGLFSIAVGTPAAIGLIVGGRVADTSGRRRLIAFALPVSTIAVVGAFMVSGPPLWALSLIGGIVASAAYPALAVYRVELFPTSNRSRAAGLVTAASLVGGVFGLLATGALLDANWSYGTVLALMAVSQVVVTALVVAGYPETAHQTLEALNPEDMAMAPDPGPTGSRPTDA